MSEQQRTKKELIDELATLRNRVRQLEERETNTQQRDSALQESEERYRSLVELSPETIFVHSGWRVVYMNPAGLALFGANTRDALMGKPVLDLIHPEYRALARSRAEQSYEHRKIADVVEEQILRVDGSVRTVEAVTAPIVYQGKPATQVILRDITVRKQAEEALRFAHDNLAQKAAELQEANAELSQYAYVASHDLRAPLRAIRNYSDFLLQDLAGRLKEEQHEYLEGLSESVRACEALVDDLLQLSRVGSRQLVYETLKLGSFLHDIVSSLRLPDTVEIEWATDWPTIESEPTLLRQIMQNLLLNGVKFNQAPQKRIELRWHPVGDNCYELFVRDNGIGIEPRHQEQIFRAFQRLHTNEEYEGTGIGLAIVKKAVSRLQGTIRIESQPGRGSTFFVTLPRVTGGVPK
jgi:PAS domain S-box-containing protein